MRESSSALRAACDAREQVGFGPAGLFEVDERIGDFAEGAFHRALPLRDRLLVARAGFVLDRLSPPGVEQRREDADPQSPYAAAGDVFDRGALPAEIT